MASASASQSQQRHLLQDPAAPSAPPAVQASLSQALAGAPSNEPRGGGQAELTTQAVPVQARGAAPVGWPAGSNADTARIFEGLAAAGAPCGLGQLVGENDRQIALRIFVLDNSGSTASYDGKYIDGERGCRSVTCSRWEEIRRMAMQQASLNAQMGTPCEFLLLNPPARRGFAAFQEGVDSCAVDSRRGDVHSQLAQLDQMLQNTRPQGTTPLTERIMEIRHRLTTVYHELATRNMRCMVIVATDGLPTNAMGLPSEQSNHEFVVALRRLTQDCPVFVVLRLSCDDDVVAAYYNKIDEEEELPLEVIDDMESEAKEVSAAGNSWLTYSPLIHMIREGGTFVRVLDLLDERRLQPAEVQFLASHILRRGLDDVLTDHYDVSSFYQDAKQRIANAGLVYDPLTRQMTPCIQQRRLARALGLGFIQVCCGRFISGRH